MKKNRTEIIEYINSLKGYEGYVQFSHRKLNIEKDVFKDKDPSIKDESGFVYEAHFCNASESIMIRQINNQWFVSVTDISTIPNEDTQTYKAVGNYMIKTAQVWESEVDNLCENMKVKKLQKVVFAGFEKGESK
jgi:CRISPR type III-associated protein (TIGR04423 family)